METIIITIIRHEFSDNKSKANLILYCAIQKVKEVRNLNSIINYSRACKVALD